MSKTETLKDYLIPVSFEMCGMLSIKANSTEEAIELAKSHIDELPIPTVKNYIDGSYQIATDDTEIIDLYTNDAKTYGQTAEPVTFQEKRTFYESKIIR